MGSVRRHTRLWVTATVMQIRLETLLKLVPPEAEQECAVMVQQYLLPD